jgi:hypothetical protein
MNPIANITLANALEAQRRMRELGGRSRAARSWPRRHRR